MLVNSHLRQTLLARLRMSGKMASLIARPVNLRPQLLSVLWIGLTLWLAGCSSNVATDKVTTDKATAQPPALRDKNTWLQDNNAAPQAPSAAVDRGPELSAADAAIFANATAAIKAARYAEGAALLTPLAARYPQAAGIHYNLALALWQQQPQSDAQQAAASGILQTIVQRRPDHVDSINLLAVLLRQQGQFQQAVTLWQQLIARDAKNAQAHKNLAMTAELYLHDKALAIQHYEAYQALTGDPKAATWLGILGVSSTPAATDADATDAGATDDNPTDVNSTEDSATEDSATDASSAEPSSPASTSELATSESATSEATIAPAAPVTSQGSATAAAVTIGPGAEANSTAFIRGFSRRDVIMAVGDVQQQHNPTEVNDV
jgi:tetratricopeptide (TPR) repeat protein